MSIQWSVIIGHSIVMMVVEHGAFIAFNSRQALPFHPWLADL